MFYWDLPQFTLEDQHQNGPNVVSFQLALGGRRWFVVGCYLDADGASTIEYVVTATGHIPHREKLMVEGGLNVDLSAKEGNILNK